MVKSIAVLGAGTMGNGIAQIAAMSGYSVIMTDISSEAVKKGLSAIDKSLGRLARKGSIDEQKRSETMGRIACATDIGAVRAADLVIEAIPEVLSLKIETFRTLDGICAKDAILASNTSALPISALAAAIKPERQAQVIGMHFMNPVPVMRGVEVIPGRQTSEKTIEIATEFVKSLGKEPCEAVDYAGFIVTRIVDAMVNEAIRCVMDGNKPEQIDKAMRLCANFPMGPLELCDLTGADIVLHGLETLHKEFGDRMVPAPLLASMVRAGSLGRKTGRGFHTYAQAK